MDYGVYIILSWSYNFISNKRIFSRFLSIKRNRLRLFFQSTSSINFIYISLNDLSFEYNTDAHDINTPTRSDQRWPYN